MTLVGEFVYCSRCRMLVRLEHAQVCEQTGAYRCEGQCLTVRVKA